MNQLLDTRRGGNGREGINLKLCQWKSQQLKKEGSSLGKQRPLGCTHGDHHESAGGRAEAWKVYRIRYKTAQPSG